MTNEMKNKLAEILDRVKDPENGMALSQLNLIAGIKHREAEKKYEVYMFPVETAKACCVVYQLSAYAVLENLLKEEIEKEFPGNTVVFKNA